MQTRRFWLGTALAVVVVIAGCGGGGSGALLGVQPQKIIIDSDYNTMSDDGQLGVMAAQLQAKGVVQVMGITVVSGNQWLAQGVSDALRSVERLGVGERIGVYAGANLAMHHSYADIQTELAAGAGGDGYLGAWSSAEPLTATDLKPTPDGFATHTQVQSKGAVDFIVDTVKANPHEITILAIGPLTNIALAAQRNPEIVPLIKRIIYMGGAVDVAGNTTKFAEFNWWFDPTAAQYVVRLPIPQVVVPLDVTDTVFLTKTIYDRIAHAATPTAVTTVFKEANGYGFDGKNGFENNPDYTQNIWDTLTLAYLVDPAFATETVERYVDVVDAPGAANNGKSVGFSSQPAAGPALQKMTVVKKFDNARFFEFYVDLLTRPVPVTLPVP
jgi:inosine-uridine nucleoside N-ribohydrolase